MMTGRTLALWLVAGCGRVAFDPLTDSGAAAASCPSFAQFCDGFESGDLSAWTRSDLSPGGTTVVSPEHVHSGQFALDATMPMQSNGASASVVHAFPPISSGMIAVREWIYSPVPIINYDSPLNLFDVFQHYALVGGANPSWVISENDGSGVTNHFGTPTPPINTWTCIELDVTFSPPKFELYVDDVLSVLATPADPAPLYREIDVGVARADIAGYRVFVDDVVQADRHIGCN
jgi:hypothetical protein